jgi:hypothetical protein
MDQLNSAHEVVRLFQQQNLNDSNEPSTLQKSERMPFTIRVVANEDDLKKAVAIRRAAYGRHLPEFAKEMSVENCDWAPGTIVLLAESKLDREPLGTMRIQTNESAPLAVERSVRLPDWCSSGRLAEATRLGVAGGMPGRMVKAMLFKALFLLCEQEQIDWLIITARSPIDLEYEKMLFRDVFAYREFVPMAHVGNLQHRVMAGEVRAARQRWREAGHSLYRFVFETCHPDIDLQMPRIHETVVHADASGDDRAD